MTNDLELVKMSLKKKEVTDSVTLENVITLITYIASSSKQKMLISLLLTSYYLKFFVCYELYRDNRENKHQDF